jgi:hypothetical protein
MNFVRGLLRLAAQKQSIKAQNGLAEGTNYAISAHTKYYTKAFP